MTTKISYYEFNNLLHGINQWITCYRVEKHQVLKIGNLSVLPPLGHVGSFKKLTWAS